jgi:hypothetical protein
MFCSALFLPAESGLASLLFWCAPNYPTGIFVQPQIYLPGHLPMAQMARAARTMRQKKLPFSPASTKLGDP